MLDYLPIIVSLAFGFATTVVGYLLSRSITDNDKKVEAILMDIKEIERQVRDAQLAIGINATEQRERLNSIADRLKHLSEDQRASKHDANETITKITSRRNSRNE